MNAICRPHSMCGCGACSCGADWAAVACGLNTETTLDGLVGWHPKGFPTPEPAVGLVVRPSNCRWAGGSARLVIERVGTGDANPGGFIHLSHRGARSDLDSRAAKSITDLKALRLEAYDGLSARPDGAASDAGTRPDSPSACGTRAVPVGPNAPNERLRLKRTAGS
jgi:hypothetical protein